MQYLVDFIHLIPTDSLMFLLIGFLIVLINSFFFLRSTRSNTRVFSFLFLIGFTLFGIGFTLIDPFLNEWDEQFHALVAKNLASHPFEPILIKDSPVPLDYKNWAQAHIWMHKQPLFLWQMAISVKTFGTTLFAVRFPSVLLHALTAVILLSIAGRFLAKPQALLASLLFGLSGYYNDYTSGAIGMDHNDVAFVFYITLSLWCWLKYRESSGQLKWQILIGIAAGAAILCKWLVGLLVFSGWGLILLLENYKNLTEWKNLLRSFFVAVCVAGPWQLYCYLRFPQEYLYEMNYNNRHLFDAVESHHHDYFFYWQTMKQAYGGGEIIRWLILLGVVLFSVQAWRNKEKWKLFFPLIFLIALAFFSVAETKLQGYITIVAPLGFLFLLVPINQLFVKTSLSKKRLPSWAIPILFIPIVYFQFGFKQVLDQHKFGSPQAREERLNQTQKALTFIEKHPIKANGYYLLKGKTANVLCSILFFTDQRVLEYTDVVAKKLHENRIAYQIVQY